MWVGQGKERSLQIVEEFRLDPNVNRTSLESFNTNTFLFRTDVLASRPLPEEWCEVEKTQGGQRVIQFERLLQEVTAVTNTTALVVPRHGTGTRFIPFKTEADIAHLAKEAIELLRVRKVIR